MNGLPLRKATPPRRMHGRFSIVVLPVFVVKAHRTQCAKMLRNWDLTHTGLEPHFELEHLLDAALGLHLHLDRHDLHVGRKVELTRFRGQVSA